MLYRPDIEGLRAIAVVSVVLFHFGVTGFNSGYIGVDIFFVISGYLISRKLLVELKATNGIRLRQFYGARIRRLFPALALMCITTAAAYALVFSPLEWTKPAKTIISVALYASNYVFYRRGNDYFADSTNQDPMLHTWSLSVEEQFYIIWPLLLLAIYRLRISNSLTQDHRIYLVLLLVVASSLLTFSYASKHYAFYLTIARSWEFGIGALIAAKEVLSANTLDNPPKIKNARAFSLADTPLIL